MELYIGDCPKMILMPGRRTASRRISLPAFERSCGGGAAVTRVRAPVLQSGVSFTVALGIIASVVIVLLH